MATRHIITMLEKTLRVETENTISHLSKSLSDRILSQSAAVHENNCYHTIGEWYKNHFLFQQDDFLWAKYVFYDAYCEAIKKQGNLTKRVRQILESLARQHGKQYIISIQNIPFPNEQEKGTA
ncbi:hypothetical protein P4U03_02955 [Bacillus mycoides]|jgi:hypothetical protein|uniref:Uncharacterized protein n=2 Tax=Bacillus cereus group TaxID=86661 RepID=J9BND0_BACCE|nr:MULTISPECIES: hypothetical protein [Bacillus cereus group]EJV74997.1 hypothetical protein IG3_05597 [Bacillus cereus HuA2-1]EOO13597.1 hypothetical protein IG9_04615 [Bacillus cereus HuA2-9]MCZ6941177.1 hypothetical protein [Bacillus mycoides]MED1265647.1 hypothetical protein [Bacillus mycoides]OTY25314.1 hypothetical protein BK732_06935 [Bacillus thuringiensis serovar navarrensis]